MLKYAALLLQNFFLITCLKRKPQDLPASDLFLVFVVFLYLVAGCIHNSLHDSMYRSLLIGGLDILLMFFFVYLFLKLLNHSNRWTQTILALAGSGLILTLFAIPVSIGLIRTQGNPAYPLFAFLLLFLFIWSISVHAHIFRHAFTLSFGSGVAIALFYNLISFMIISSMIQTQGNI